MDWQAKNAAEAVNGSANNEAIDAALKQFENQERQRLNLVEQAIEHWVDLNPTAFARSERADTTILFGGLTRMQDHLISAAVTGLGYRFVALDTPDLEALRYGKEFGNRGQCSPTYFTSGNLVKYLVELRDKRGMSAEEIIARHVFVTAGACGPCRFGTYATEYRKALRDAGFEGFRIILFQQQGGLRQSIGEHGLDLNPTFFTKVVTAIVAGDILNIMSYRIRPYEIEPGATDRAIEDCKTILRERLSAGRSIWPALWQCRRRFSAIKVDHTRVKPKVAIIGEFWAMTTEGDGNYNLHRFLEAEGAEVEIQTVTAWLLYMIWQVRWDTHNRMTLRGEDEGRFGLAGRNVAKRLRMMWLAEFVVRRGFGAMAAIAGLKNFHLPDMDELARIAHEHYDNHLRGGEGHMEVGKLMLTARKRKAHMMVSIKPFGCMPSSGVSDGIQSLVKAKYPGMVLSMIETTGEGAVNALSRVQMDLFRAREIAASEHDEALRRKPRLKFIRHIFKRGALAYPGIKGIAGTAARFAAQG